MICGAVVSRDACIQIAKARKTLYLNELTLQQLLPNRQLGFRLRHFFGVVI